MSIISENSRRTGREGTDVSGVQATDASVITVQPPTPVSSQESDSGAGTLSREIRLCSKNSARAGLSRDEDTIAGRKISVQKAKANQLDSESETLMESWTRWSAGWEAGFHCEKDTFFETGVSVDCDTIDRPHYDSDTLMQDWREWCGNWERSVKSR